MTCLLSILVTLGSVASVDAELSQATQARIDASNAYAECSGGCERQRLAHIAATARYELASDAHTLTYDAVYGGES